MRNCPISSKNDHDKQRKIKQIEKVIANFGAKKAGIGGGKKDQIMVKDN